MQTETLETEAPATGPAETKPIVASLVLMQGTGQTVVQIPGRKGKYPFYRQPGAGLNGGMAHVRNYSDLETFQREEQDIRSVRSGLFIVSRIGQVLPFERARAGIAQVIADPLGSPAQKEEKLRALLALITAAMAGGQSAPAEEEEPAEPEPTAEDDGPVSVLKREARARELRRIGEDEVRRFVRDEYQIGGVRLLDNLDGMVTAVLAHEQSRGDFDHEPPAPPVPTPAPVDDSSGPFGPEGGPGPDGPVLEPAAGIGGNLGKPVAYTEAQLTTMKIDDLRGVAGLHGLPKNASRRVTVAAILEKQKG